MTVHEIVQNIIEEFELTQKYVEAVRNERSAAFEGHADESQAEERLIDALREGRVRIDRERDRLNRSDPGFARTDGFAPYNSGLILANLERTLDQSLADFKRHFKEQIAGSLRPPTPRPNQRFVPNKKLGDWYIVTIETTVNVVNNLVNLYQKQHQRVPISRSVQLPEEDWRNLQDGSWYKGGVGAPPPPMGVPPRSGHGTCVYPDGKRYDGEWKDDKRNGLGVLTWPIVIRIKRKFFGFGTPTQHLEVNFSYYEGDWQDDQRSGYGVWHKPGDGKYMGTWKNDKREGFGICHGERKEIDNNFPTYEGEYHHDKRDGYGRFGTDMVTVFDGTWSEGRPYTGTAINPDTGVHITVDKGQAAGGQSLRFLEQIIEDCEMDGIE